MSISLHFVTMRGWFPNSTDISFVCSGPTNHGFQNGYSIEPILFLDKLTLYGNERIISVLVEYPTSRLVTKLHSQSSTRIIVLSPKLSYKRGAAFDKLSSRNSVFRASLASFRIIDDVAAVFRFLLQMISQRIADVARQFHIVIPKIIWQISSRLEM